jgi:hypothetical protein
MEESSSSKLKLIEGNSHVQIELRVSLPIAIGKLLFTIEKLLSALFWRSNRDRAIDSIPELEITVERINGLGEEEEEDEYGENINPTEYAVKAAIELVSKTARSISEKFFKAWVSTEDSGGVILIWSKPELDKKVRLVIPPIPDRKIYLYHEMAEEYGIEYNVSAKTLSEWLSWCNSK